MEYHNVYVITFLGIFIHILLLLAVFDTYFKSPLEHGIIPVKSSSHPPSKRIVLIIADGLRAQAILKDNEGRAKFLTSVRKHRGSWGISHTRVPTESRPGHVAILAGIFEDPSAIFKGWKHNPVDFDSVVNQSKNAWCIGSPDIVPIFNKDNQRHINIHSYEPEMQDFGNKKTTILDKWVFDKTEAILKDSNHNEKIDQYGNLFFLHLLGLDTAGHAFKPDSVEYIDNIKFVDENIEVIEKLFSEKFQDNLTTFIFTSDHGMTDWGSHGSGLDHETHTPIIAWGAGIKINDIQNDINQIDIAPLISSLIGINYPTNNLGKLPINYLNISNKNKLNNFLTNIQQIFNIFIFKEQKIKKSAIFYKSYKVKIEKFDETFAELWHSSENFDIIFEKSDVLFNEIVKGINYCHNYFMNFILFSVSLGLLFWVVYLSTFLFFKENIVEERAKDTNNVLKIFMISYSILVIYICQLQSFPYLYYVYFLFPGFMLNLFFKNFRHFHIGALRISSISYLIFFSISIVLFIYGFQYRFCFSLIMITTFFSIYINPSNAIRLRKELRYSWMLICFVLAIFPLLPLMFTKFQIVYFIFGYFSWQLLTNFISISINENKWLFFNSLSMQSPPFQIKINQIQKIIFHLSFLNSLIISLDLFENVSIFKNISWVLFSIPIFLIPFSVNSLQCRIVTIILAFGPFYVMTTMSYELIFLSFYCTFLLIWALIEQNIRTSESNRNMENFRKCIIFVGMILIGFFGTGNIASLNSFDPMWVRCFLTIFSPFTMTILIFVKLTIPFLFTTCVFRYIVLKTDMNLVNSFCVILLISDIMVFYFMFNIKNVGSWLEIGISLSHFVVVECLTIGILVFYFVAYLFTNIEMPAKFLKKFRSIKII